ncbi:xanthine dehydrogenase/oxidase-like [Tubulanus polymorphus]|uniref:xanthine dehydrogenase/oxidase-like n=1 Tax=Tubulanus polymorphus TaxID=672921 RepID=UPI003DA1F97D
MAALYATQVLTFFVNGKKITDNDVDPEWTLLQYLRNRLLLTGTKLACGQAGCGACTVMVSRYDRHQKKIVHSAVPACVVFIGSVHGMTVTTVEGVGNRKKLHPIQERIAKYHGSQCGFCTPGMVMSMYALLRNNPNPSISEIENAMQGNLCRCTGYRPIYQAFVTFADKDFDCGMGDQCCKNNTVDQADDMATNLIEGTLQNYSPEQEPIFPNELQLSDILDRNIFHCKGKRIDWYRPTSLSELFKIKDMFPYASVIGGGLYIRKNKIYPDKSIVQLVSVSHIRDLCEFMFADGGIHIGAACSLGMLSTALSSSIEKTQVTSVFRMAVEKNTSIIQELCIISSGLDGRIKLASETMKEAVGKKLCDSVVSSLSKILTDEIKPCTDNTGGAVQYRRSLVLGFFFKFYLSIQMKSNENVDLSSSAAVRELQREPLKASQIFEKVDGSAHDTIGKPLPQIMNPCHATGETLYVDDIPSYRNELFIAYVYSKHAHAQILSVDPSEALNVDGVVSYIDHNDVPASNYFGPVVKDEELFATKFVTCCGQIIGAIAAENRDIARKAAALVNVEFEVLKPIVTIEEAIENKSFFKPVYKVDKGDVDAAFTIADYIVEGELHTGSQEHFYMETNATVAVPVKENDEMIIYTTTQDLCRIQTDVCRALGLVSNKVVVKHKRIGGGFGGKQSRDALVCLTAAIAANKLQCPVRSSLERVEDLRITGRRHPFLGKYKVAFTKEGKIQALDLLLYCNGGHSLDVSNQVMECAIQDVDHCYILPINMRLKGLICRTNLASNTGFRGFGRLQSAVITESWIEQMSSILDMTPEQIREINLYKEVAPDCFGMEVDGKVLHRCWKDVVEQSKYKDLQKEVERFNSQNRWKKRGVAVVPTKNGNGFSEKFLSQAAALVHVYLDGSVLLTHGGVEMGQGVHTKAIQVASRVLGISVDKIHITDVSTDKIPNSICSSASICSDYIAMATKNACETIMDRLKPFKESKPDAGWDGWVLSAWLENVYLSATGYHSVDDVYFDWEKGVGRHCDYFTYGAACSMVEIDCLTGEHKVLKTDIVIDVGASLNPGIDIGQIDGAFMQGYGFYMTEEVNVSPNGEVLTTGPASYNLPRFKNLPNEYNVTILKGSRNPRAIYSSKGVGEPPMLLAVCVYCASKKAILSARSDAGLSGYFRLDCPATAEKVRLACTDQFTKPFEQRDEGRKPWSIVE